MEILEQFPTRRALVAHLETIKSHGSAINYETFEHDLWVKWARARRSFRFVTLFQALLSKAERNKTTTYGDLANIIDLGSNNELNHLINHIGTLCKANGWAPYPVLIKNQKTGKVGNGFFKFFAKEIGDDNERALFEHKCEEECFNKPLPDQTTILCRLVEYIHLHLK